MYGRVFMYVYVNVSMYIMAFVDVHPPLVLTRHVYVIHYMYGRVFIYVHIYIKYVYHGIRLPLVLPNT